MIVIADGDNAWNMIRKVRGFMLVVASKGFPHQLPTECAPHQVLERVTSTSKDAADMLAAFRAGQLAQSLHAGSYRPHIVVLSRDLAFEALPHIFQQIHISATFVNHPQDVPGSVVEPLPPCTRALLSEQGVNSLKCLTKKRKPATS